MILYYIYSSETHSEPCQTLTFFRKKILNLNVKKWSAEGSISATTLKQVLTLTFICLLSNPACDVVATSHLGLIWVETSQTMLRPHHDIATGTWIRRTYWDVFVTSHWYVATYHWHLEGTDQFNMWQRRHIWYLNETDVFETL